MIDWSREIVTCTPGLLPLEPVALPADAGARSGLPRHGRGLVVPQGPDRAGQRAGAGREYLRALRQRGLQARPGAVVLPHHRLRRRAAARRRDARLAGARADDAAQLDRPLRRRTPALHPGDGRRAGGLHHPPRHGLGRDLHGAGPGASAGGEDHHARAPGRGRGLRRAGAPADRDRADVDRRVAGAHRGVHRRLRHQPRHRRAHPGLDRRLRADGVRHRGDHGRALRRSARLRVRPRLRSADPRHRAAGGWRPSSTRRR